MADEQQRSGGGRRTNYFVDDEPQKTSQEELTVERILEKAGARMDPEQQAFLYELRGNERLEHRDPGERIRIRENIRFTTKRESGGDVEVARGGTEYRTAGTPTASSPIQPGRESGAGIGGRREQMKPSEMPTTGIMGSKPGENPRGGSSQEQGRSSAPSSGREQSNLERRSEKGVGAGAPGGSRGESRVPLGEESMRQARENPAKTAEEQSRAGQTPGETGGEMFQEGREEAGRAGAAGGTAPRKVGGAGPTERAGGVTEQTAKSELRGEEAKEEKKSEQNEGETED